MSDPKALEKALALVQRLHARTREGKIDWKDTNAETEVKVTLAPFVLQLRQVHDPDFPTEPDYELEVVEENSDRTVELITNRTLRPVMDRLTEEGLNPYRLMALTFEMARREALGVDNALDSILKDLADE